MASYGYGYAGSPSQSYANVQQQGTYPTQNTAAAGYASQQPQYATQARHMVQTGYGVASAYPTSNYGYGRPDAQVHNSQAGYGQSAYASRDSTYDSAKQGYYSSPSQGTNTGYTYATQQPVKQESYQSAASSGGQYPSHSMASGYNAGGQVLNTTHKKTGNQSHAANAYEGVVYNAATSFLQQQSQTTKPQWHRQTKPQFRLHGKGRGGGNQGPPRTEQLHYCEVCKISCAGAGTYKEHLDGQKHKKKEALVAAQSKMSVPRGSYRCELCCITCTGADAYNAHIKGARHIKTVKLHQKLGKPIPESKGPPPQKTIGVATTSTTPHTITKIATPKINFIGGTKLFTTKDDTTGEARSKVAETIEPVATASTQEEVSDAVEDDAQIVGEEYVENAPDDAGRANGFKCTLCDCRFNDDVAKVAHLKGRRHRLSYKRKVQPSLKVEMKASRRNARTVQDERAKRSKDSEFLWRQRQDEQMHREHQLRMREEELRRWEEDEYDRRIGEDKYWTRPDRHRAVEMERYENDNFEQKPFTPLMDAQNLQHKSGPSFDDRVVMAKHSSVYPTDEELKQVQNTVSTVEKSLKLVSDHLTVQSDMKAQSPGTEKKDQTEGQNDKPVDGVNKEPAHRALKGVMRVGILAKGLLLKNQLNVSVVVLCTDVPTVNLLNQVASILPQKLQEVSDEKYSLQVEGHQILIQSEKEPKCTVTVCLTSPVVRQQEEKLPETGEQAIAEEPVVDALDKEKCLEALASLRHAKWFQAKANGQQSCVIVIRIVRDLRNHVEAFKPLTDWMIELLVEKSLGSSRFPLGPGLGFRRVLELLSSGILLPGGSGLLDPCEKEQTDAMSQLKPQECEDITFAAQNALRMLAFRQIGQVLSIDVQDIQSRGAKRRCDSSSDTQDSSAKHSRQDGVPGIKVKTEDLNNPKSIPGIDDE